MEAINKNKLGSLLKQGFGIIILSEPYEARIKMSKGRDWWQLIKSSQVENSICTGNDNVIFYSLLSCSKLISLNINKWYTQSW